MDTDPFSMVFDALWRMVERNRELIQYLNVANRIKFEEESDQKVNITDGDLPELVLLSSGAVFGGKNNSTCSSITRDYTWTLATGDFRINPVYNRISFELYRSLIDYEPILCELLWNNSRFVNGCRIVNAEEGTIMQKLDKGIQGWSALWTCEVDFVFVTQSLRIS